ncbi:uncharacterized protein LOC115875768 [Sitophilus oryzae]|uniref:Uncharacterized protein LOC115875768 n=1 Tax=Sitophilus oryzae TaxID=7048 RepID=A0A6J2X7B6_SITOR|nr:uncharacterized protein LOC115875768 [Sitophilus oryzae]
MAITVRPKYSCIKKPSKRKVINTAKLADPNIRSELGLRISETLTRATDTESDDPEHIWINIRDAIQSECEKSLGETVRCNKDWFRDKDEEIESALQLKRKAHAGLVNNPECRQAQKHFATAKHEAQKTIRAAKNSWWKSKVNEIQAYADNNDSRRFFQALREVYGPVNSFSLIRDVNGQLLKDDTEIRHRWKEHFWLVLNQNSNIDQEIYYLLPQYDAANFLSVPLTRKEIADAIASLKNNKATGKDSIPAEIYKALTPELMPHLENLFTVIWERESVPQDFRDSIIISLYKNKGDKTECGNYRGISLLAVAGKILEKIIINRMMPYVDKLIPDFQSGFRPRRSTVNMVFCLRQIQEKTIEQQQNVHFAFIDITKALDTVNRDAL